MSRILPEPSAATLKKRQIEILREASARERGYGKIPINSLGLRQVGRAFKATVTPWRALNWTGYAIGFGLFELGLRGAQTLDDLLFPEWREQSIDAPVFVIGNPRSGTTMLHRLLSLDEANFAPYTLAHSLFPSVGVRRLISLGAAIDPKIPGRPLRRFVDGINAVFFSGWDGIHELGIDKAEEDEATFLFSFNTMNFCLTAPDMESLLPLAKADEDDLEFQRRFMAYYEAQMRRHLYADGKNRRFLNKNVFMIGRLARLEERFPDAKYIYLIRDPYESIPSFMSMWWEKWVSDDANFPKDGPDTRMLAELAVYFYERAMKLRHEIGEDRFLIVDYRDLVRDAKGTVERIYDFLGLEASPEFCRELEKITATQREYESRHDYSLEDFGLSRQWVYERLKWLFDEFGFEP